MTVVVELKQCDFLFNKITQNTYWECIACQIAKFPFANVSNHEIQCLAINSNFTCKCQTMLSGLVGDHLTLNFSSLNSKDRPQYNTVKTIDEYFEDLSIQPDFNITKLMTFINLPKNKTKETALVSYTLIFAPSVQTWKT